MNSYYDNSHRNPNESRRSSHPRQQGGDAETQQTLPTSGEAQVHHHHYHYYDNSSSSNSVRRSSQRTQSTCPTGKSIPSIIEGNTAAGAVPSPEDLGYNPSQHQDQQEEGFVQDFVDTASLAATNADASFAPARTVVIKTEHHYHYHYHYAGNNQVNHHHPPPHHHHPTTTTHQAEVNYRPHTDLHEVDEVDHASAPAGRKVRQQQQQQRRKDSMDNSSSRRRRSVRRTGSGDVSDPSISSHCARGTPLPGMAASAPPTTISRPSMGRRESMKGSRATSTPALTQENDMYGSSSRRRFNNGVCRRDSMSRKTLSTPDICADDNMNSSKSSRHRTGGKDYDKKRTVDAPVDPPSTDRWSHNMSTEYASMDHSKKSTSRRSRRTRRASMGSIPSMESDNSSFVKSPMVREKGNLSTMKTILLSLDSQSNHSGRSSEINKSSHRRPSDQVKGVMSRQGSFIAQRRGLPSRQSSFIGLQRGIPSRQSSFIGLQRGIPSRQGSFIGQQRGPPSRQGSFLGLQREAGNLATVVAGKRLSSQSNASSAGVTFTDAVAIKNSSQIGKSSRNEQPSMAFLEQDEEVSLACSSKASRRSTMPVLHVAVPIGTDSRSNVPGSPLPGPASISSGHVPSLNLSEAAMTADNSTEANTASGEVNWPPRQPSRMLPFLHTDDDSSRPSQRSRERSCSMPLLGLVPAQDDGSQRPIQSTRKSDVGISHTRNSSWHDDDESLFDHEGKRNQETDSLTRSEKGLQEAHFDDDALRSSFYQRQRAAEEANNKSFARIGISAEELGYGDLDEKPFSFKPKNEEMNKSAKSEAMPRMPRRSIDTGFPDALVPNSKLEELDNQGDIANRGRMGSFDAPRMPRRSVDGTMGPGEDAEMHIDEMSLNSAAMEVVISSAVVTASPPVHSGQGSSDDVPVQESDRDAVDGLSGSREDGKSLLVSEAPLATQIEGTPGEEQEEEQYGEDKRHDDNNDGDHHNDDSREVPKSTDAAQGTRRRHTLSMLFDVQKKHSLVFDRSLSDIQYSQSTRGRKKAGHASISDLKYCESFDDVDKVDDSKLGARIKRRLSYEPLVNFMKARMRSLSTELDRNHIDESPNREIGDAVGSTEFPIEMVS